MEQHTSPQPDTHDTHPDEPVRLDADSLLRGALELAERDADLRRVLERYGPPPLWDRKAGFPTLLHIILEQQVSLASARAAFNRLLQATPDLTPHSFLQFNDSELKTIGFSRQKAGYGRELAQRILDGRLDLAAMESMNDLEARAELLKINGIGPWTADIYLLMVLLRPNVWPHGDRALAVSVARVKGLEVVPSYDHLTAMSAAWHPWRAVAARLFWHDYLSR